MNEGKYVAGGVVQDTINKQLNNRHMVLSFEHWQELERAAVERDVYKGKRASSFIVGLLIGMLLTAVTVLLMR